MSLFSDLKKVREKGNGSVTYNFENGSKQVSQINNNVFYNERGKPENLTKVMDIFITTAHDLKALSFNF
jgi:hypothetical protein